MSRSAIVVGGAALAAVGIFLLTLLAPDIKGPPRDPAAPVLGMPGGIQNDPNAPGTPGTPGAGRGGLRTTPFESINKYYFNFRNKKSQLIEFIGRTLKPLPEGRQAITGPMIRWHFSDTSIVQIRSERGEFLAPGNQPRSGSFNDHVVVSFFDFKNDRALTLADFKDGSEYETARFLVDSLHFDVELGQLDSDSAVHGVSRRFDLQGDGFSMAYNDARNTIDRIEVLRGKQLLWKEQRATPPVAGAAAKPAAAPGKKPDDKQAQPQAATQPFYRAIFERDVIVTQPGRRISGDRLTAFFSVGTHGEGLFNGGNQQPSGGAATQPAPANLPPLDPWRESPAPQSRDSLVTWKGALVVEPVTEVPAGLAPDGDVQAVVNGRPMLAVLDPEAVKDDRTTISGELGELRWKSKWMHVRGSSDYPMKVISERNGRLNGPELFVDALGSKANPSPSMWVPGAGTLQTTSTPRAANRSTNDPLGSLPPGLTAKWSKGFKVDFYGQDADALAGLEHGPGAAGGGDAAAANRRGPQFRDIIFTGKVAIRSDQLDLDADDQLVLNLDEPPAPAKGARAQPGPGPAPRQLVTDVNAAGNVKARATSGAQPPMLINSDALALKMWDRAAMGEQARMAPQLMTATGHVTGSQADRRLAADKMEVEFNPPTTQPASGVASGAARANASADASAARNKQFDSIKRTTLTGKATASDGESSLHGDTIIAEGAGDVVEAIGRADPDHFASAQSRDSSVFGQRVHLVKATQVLSVNGPGWFEYLSWNDHTQRSARGNDAAKTPATREGPATTAVRVAWKESMEADNVKGLAHFVGEVKSDSTTLRDVTRMTCGDLKMWYDPTPPGRSDGKTAGPSAGAATPTTGAPTDAMSKGVKQVRRMEARDDVDFEASSYTDDAQKQLSTRLRIVGGNLTFDALKEEIRVDGPGKWYIEDNREKDKSLRTADGGAPGNAAVDFAGKGATLFTWTGSMTLDTLNNDMKLVDKVTMLHSAGDKRTQMDSQTLVADLEATGGLNVWLNGKAAQPEIKAVNADTNVRVLTGGRTINTDHLEYLGPTQTIHLRSDEGKLTEVSSDTEPLTAEAITWDLAHDKITIDRPGVTRVPAKK